MKLMTMPNQRQLLTIVAIISTTFLLLSLYQHRERLAGGTVAAYNEKPKDAAEQPPPTSLTRPPTSLTLPPTSTPPTPPPTSTPPPPPPPPPPKPRYKPAPEFVPPPIKENFPLLASSPPPPIPKWNIPRKNAHKTYDLPVAPPLFIGFTRSWPILQQAVVSYITAGWPADQIYVIENTGVQQANARGQLTLQNPFYLNHTTLKTTLGVNIIQTPTLLNFAQLQNFYLSLTYTHSWPYYFWSHMDVLALSYEDGREGLTPQYNEPGYRSIYELALQALHEARTQDDRWGIRFFAYDHLALVNPVAYEDVGGWDSLIPFYITDCDMHSRLAMRNWTMKDARAGIITDVSVTLDDLRALYRVEGVEPAFTDPNPPPPEKPKPTPAPPEKKWLDAILNRSAREIPTRAPRRITARDVVANMPPSTQLSPRERVRLYRGPEDDGLERREEDDGQPKDEKVDKDLEVWRKLGKKAEQMFHYKHGNRGRNTWQVGQRGGQGEPFYYNAAGFNEAIDVMTESGKEIFRRKWGHRDCALREKGGLKFDDQWLVEKDWE
ncbi:hypothetical protein B0T19DRAFT_292460 [Cercophora scortea]|uniref:Uncharacterized protein n=1 Tax=Cercophora scortea TaxID=314031 RepID=A0AAE0I2M5_9PEZI|nr:hypothetical protein B0T19DRAFT_292460 [Cercophora scortea]